MDSNISYCHHVKDARRGVGLTGTGMDVSFDYPENYKVSLISFSGHGPLD